MVYNSKTINRSTEIYDTFVTGSDQVWNTDFIGKEYFLNFVPDSYKKIAYAASIGKTNFSIKEKKELKPLIERFSAISVRENIGKEILNTFINKNVEITLDPTMLLSDEEWSTIATEKLINQPYILVILLRFTSFQSDIIKKYVSVFSMPVILISDCFFLFNEDNSEFADIKDLDAGPREFISLIKNAEYVFTDSFHGTAFSIIFKRNFFSLNTVSNNQLNSRIENITQIFNMENRIIAKDTILTETELKENIDYSQTQGILDELRKKSIDFLRNSLDDSK